MKFWNALANVITKAAIFLWLILLALLAAFAPLALLKLCVMYLLGG